jgi:hypothetical protein
LSGRNAVRRARAALRRLRRPDVMTSTQLGLKAAAAPVDLDVRLGRSQGLQSARFKEPRQPERVMAYVIAGRDHDSATLTWTSSLGPE